MLLTGITTTSVVDLALDRRRELTALALAREQSDVVFINEGLERALSLENIAVMLPVADRNLHNCWRGSVSAQRSFSCFYHFCHQL